MGLTRNSNTADFYGRNEYKMMAGIAIILIFINHLFGFPDWLAPGNYYVSLFSVGGTPVERILSLCTHVDIGIFAFSSGYVMYKARQKYIDRRERYRRLTSFIADYWFVCLLYLIYAIAIGDSLPSPRQLLANLAAWGLSPSADHVNVVFAWYVGFYVILLLLVPLIMRLLSTRSVVIDALILGILIGVIWWMDISVLKPLPIAVCGFMTSKWQGFELLHSRLPRRAIYLMPLAVMAVAVCTYWIDWPYLEGLSEVACAFIMIFACVEMLRRVAGSLLAKILLFLGTYSMNMWFLQGLFFTGTRPLQALLYWPRVSVLVLLWGILLTIPAAMVCTWLQKKLKAFLLPRLGFKPENRQRS